MPVVVSNHLEVAEHLPIPEVVNSLLALLLLMDSWKIPPREIYILMPVETSLAKFHLKNEIREIHHRCRARCGYPVEVQPSSGGSAVRLRHHRCGIYMVVSISDGLWDRKSTRLNSSH